MLVELSRESACLYFWSRRWGAPRVSIGSTTAMDFRPIQETMGGTGTSFAAPADAARRSGE